MPAILRRSVLLAVVVALIAAVALPPTLMYERLHPPRLSIEDDPGRHGLRYEDVAFSSSVDGTPLRGWHLFSSRPSGRWVVVAPGIDDDRLVGDVTLRLAPALLAAGYDVLAFDLRAQGLSAPSMETFGAHERWDVEGAVAEARARGASRVAVLGFSMGAAAALLAASESSGIDAVIADSAFADLAEILTHELTVNDHLPAPLAAYGLFLFRALSGVDPASVSPVRAIAAVAPRPVLLIHGDEDSTVPLEDSERLLVAGGTSTTRWVVAGGRHARSYDADPAGYAARVLAFLERALA